MTLTPQELAILHEVKDWLPLIAAAIAVYLGLRLRPIERAIADEITARAKEEKAMREELEKLEAKLDAHLSDSVESYHNFDRWRGSVSTLLESNARDHDEMKRSLGSLADKLADMAGHRPPRRRTT